MSGGGGNDSDWRPTSTIVPTTKPGAGSGGGGGGGINPCHFTEVTNISSPNSAVAGTLAVGSVLSLSLQQNRVLVMSGSNPAGSITSARLADFVQCMSAGQRYDARVVAINGGAITVEIYPV